jgi:ribosomal protein L32
MNNIVTKENIIDFLNGNLSVQDTIDVLETMAFDSSLEEHVISTQRMNYARQIDADYGSFLPISKMAADDGENLCDFQCESYLLKKHGKEISDSSLVEEAKSNYWLRSMGTPLYNIGKLLESNGLLVNRVYDADVNKLCEALEEYDIIVVVNGFRLSGNEEDPFSEDNPNHAVVVVSIDKVANEIVLYNPATGNEKDVYSLTAFEEAWNESKNYVVLIREKEYENEYNPRPIDVSDVSLTPDLLELIDTIAENAHNVWAEEKLRKNPGLKYAPLDKDGHEVKGCNHFFRPYTELPEEDKKPDVDMAVNTIKLLKRLGYRIVNVNKLNRCPDCGEPIEMHHLFCSHCGKKLSWEDFK